MKHHALYLFFLVCAVSSAFGQWVLQTSARNCSAMPYTVVGLNINCININGIYQKIECDSKTASYFECTSSDCSSGCKNIFTQHLNDCNNGVTVRCYPNAQPDYNKLLGNDYVLNSLYDDQSCEGDVITATAYSTSFCRGPSSNFNIMYTCQNNTVQQNVYRRASGSMQKVSSLDLHLNKDEIRNLSSLKLV